MPSLSENQVRWTDHPWEREGEEWSPGGTAAGGEMFWWYALMPRLHTHLPASRVLEIGPGFGRWTSHLESHVDRLLLVDLTARCIEHCRRRFAHRSHIEYWTNDGQSLDMVEDESLDFVFSFDSLVHAESAVLRGYLVQLGHKLKPGGTGFIHHSNLAALAAPDGTFPSWLVRKNWRGETMSASLFRDHCHEAGLTCVTQEIINWVSRSRKADRHRIYGTGLPMTDAMSSFMRATDGGSPTKVYVNPLFAHEWRQCTVLADVYGRRAVEGNSLSPSTQRSQDEGYSAERGFPLLIRKAQQRLSRAKDHAASFCWDQLVARQVRRHEPILNSLLRRRCPDCHRDLMSDNGCVHCNAQFYFPTPRSALARQYEN